MIKIRVFNFVPLYRRKELNMSFLSNDIDLKQAEMKKIVILLIFATISITVATSQKNPDIKSSEVLSSIPKEKQKTVQKLLKEGENAYRKGIYHHAVRNYMQVFEYHNSHPALNYKLGVSALYGDQSIKAAYYLEQVTDTEVASDLFYQLGKAYMAIMDYERARIAFSQHNHSLKRFAKRRFAASYQNLLDKCAAAPQIMQDSLPFFVNNMGPTVNSNFDEYAAVLFPDNEMFLYTTRRPERMPEKPVDRTSYPERIHMAEYQYGSASESSSVKRLNATFNTSVAGANVTDGTLFYYTGKVRSGSIRQAYVSRNLKKSSRVKGATDSRAFQITSLTVSNNGDAFFVANRRGGEGGMDIWQARKTGKKSYRKARNMGASINTPFDENAVYVTPDGTTLYFSSNGHPGLGGFDIFRSRKQEDGSWSLPENLGYPINSAADDLFYFPAQDSLTFFLASNRSGGFGGLDIYKITKDTRIPFVVWGEVTDGQTGAILQARIIVLDADQDKPLLFEGLDPETGEFYIELEDKGNFLIRAEANGYNSLTVPLSNPLKRHDRIRNDFKLERLLYPYTLWGKIYDNSTENPVQAEIQFRTAGADSVIYRAYSDSHSGNYSITFADKADMIMEIIATDYFTHTEKLALKNAKGSELHLDIALTRSRIPYTVSGVVTDKNSGQPVAARLFITESGEDNPFAQTRTTAVNGRYSLTVEEKGPFLLEVNAEGYFFANIPFTFNADSTNIIKNIELQRMATGARIVVENILFSSGNATIRAESYPDLNRLARLLIENQDVRIEVSGHTDNVGSATLNKRLSRSRAQAVKNYLVSQGVDGNRIEFEGYGFDKPIAPNTTPQGREANRRVEIEVIE